MDRLFGRKKSTEGKEAAAAAAAGASASSPAPAPSAALRGPPSRLAADPTYNEGISQINAALRAEDAGEWTRALECYDSGLQLLLALLKRGARQVGDKEPDAEAARARDLLRGVIDKYMTRAEQLKSKRQAREAGTGTGAGNGHTHAHAHGAQVQPAMLRARSGPQPQQPHAVGSARPAARGVFSPPSSSSQSASPAVASPASPSVQQIDPALRAAIESEILAPNSSGGVTFDRIIGLDEAKQALREMVILPALRPDLFTGVRSPPRGLLLHGPPGCGKTMLAAAVARESHATFFSISAATLVSKHLGEGERLVRALFAVARERAPSVIFIDEVDSIMGRRGGDEHEASRRLKTEFLIQFDGISSSSSADPAARVTVLAATNIPEELDEALIRRLSRRIYIPVPDAAARRALLHSLLSQASLVHELSAPQIERLVDATEGHSNSDLTALVSDAALAPLRALSPEQLLATPANKAPPVRLEHFQTALQRVRPSVSAERLQAYEAWSKKQEGAR